MNRLKWKSSSFHILLYRLESVIGQFQASRINSWNGVKDGRTWFVYYVRLIDDDERLWRLSILQSWPRSPCSISAVGRWWRDESATKTAKRGRMGLWGNSKSRQLSFPNDLWLFYSTRRSTIAVNFCLFLNFFYFWYGWSDSYTKLINKRPTLPRGFKWETVENRIVCSGHRLQMWIW